MLLIGGHALALRGQPLGRAASDIDLYGSLDELSQLNTAITCSIGRRPFLSSQSAPGRFTLRSVGIPVIEFDSLSPDVLELADALPDNQVGRLFGIEVQLSSPLTVHLIKLAYLRVLPLDQVHPKHDEDVERFAGAENLAGAISRSKPHQQFYEGLCALIAKRREH